MGNELTIFKNADFGEIRTFKNENDEPWFIAKDIAQILGYSNPRDAIKRHVDDEDKGVAKCDTLGGKQDLVIINESGLYSLILNTKLPQAKQFKHWVTSEVLPTIRKTGGYIQTKIDDTPEAIMARGLIVAQETIKRLLAKNNELAVKADYLDNVILNERCYTTTFIGKELGLSHVELYDYLVRKKILFKQGKQYFLYADYAYLKLAKTRTAQKVMADGTLMVFDPYLVWTERGRIFIHNLYHADPPQITRRIAIMFTQPSLFS